MGDTVELLTWKRPQCTEFPKVWFKFMARDTGTDELVEYRIQDLPECKFDDGIEFMVQHFCKDEPVCAALEIDIDMNAISDFKWMWKSAFKQKMAIACFEEGSNEIVGLNANYIKSKDDAFVKELSKHIQHEKTRKFGEMMFLLRKNCNIFELYEVNECLTSVGLIVDQKYRGRGIAECLLKIRKEICKEFGIRLTSTIFTSDTSNRIADRVGFKLDKIIRYDDIRNTHPHINLQHIRSNAMTIKSILYR